MTPHSSAGQSSTPRHTQHHTTTRHYQRVSLENAEEEMTGRGRRCSSAGAQSAAGAHSTTQGSSGFNALLFFFFFFFFFVIAAFVVPAFCVLTDHGFVGVMLARSCVCFLLTMAEHKCGDAVVALLALKRFHPSVTRLIGRMIWMTKVFLSCVCVCLFVRVVFFVFLSIFALPPFLCQQMTKTVNRTHTAKTNKTTNKQTNKQTNNQQTNKNKQKTPHSRHVSRRAPYGTAAKESEWRSDATCERL
jgi:hypothetical protein